MEIQKKKFEENEKKYLTEIEKIKREMAGQQQKNSQR